MRHRFIFLLTFNVITILPTIGLRAQATAGELKLLHNLDSISRSPSISSYFAELYFATMINAIRFFDSVEDPSKNDIRTMEARFAKYFFDAADSFSNGRQIPSSWKKYYADTSATPLRHVLLGINAHMNGDIWQALSGSFSSVRLNQLKPLYYSYYHGLLNIYDHVYENARAQNAILRLLHVATFGIDKWYGEQLLRRWMKRQMKLACAYHGNADHFKKKLNRLERKMARLDRAILRHF